MIFAVSMLANEAVNNTHIHSDKMLKGICLRPPALSFFPIFKKRWMLKTLKHCKLDILFFISFLFFYSFLFFIAVLAISSPFCCVSASINGSSPFFHHFSFLFVLQSDKILKWGKKNIFQWFIQFFLRKIIYIKILNPSSAVKYILIYHCRLLKIVFFYLFAHSP
jgi:hypothetical protein